MEEEEEELELLTISKNKEKPVDCSLHEAAKCGKTAELEELLRDPFQDPFALDAKGKTPLHHAVCCGNPRTALNCVEIILNCPRVLDDLKGFVDIQDDHGETALHLAAKHESQKVVEKLIFAAADVNLKSKEGKDPLGLIYSKVPTAMVSVLNLGVQVKEGCEVLDDDLRLILDFGAIIGYFSEEEAAERRYYCKESQLLSYALDDSPKSSKEILTHPLVKLFLELKWRKIRYLFWLSIFFHISWLILYTVFITEAYLLSCPYRGPADVNGSHHSQVGQKTSRFTWFGFSSEYLDYENVCLMTPACKWMAYVLVGMSAVVAIKEFFEIASSRKVRWYFKGVENLGQWTLIFTVVALTYPVMFSKDIQDWVYEVSAFGVFLAWSLILTQIGKYPKLGMHVEILARVLKSFAMFMLIFASLLIAFALSLSLLLPGNKAFLSLPLAFMKVVVMMTGELEYNNFFVDDDGVEPAFPVSGRIIYLFFVVVVSITLFNLLIGFTVSDIQVGQSLQQKAEVHKLSNQLEQIYLMESFILSRNLQIVLCKRRRYLSRYLVSPQPEPIVCAEGNQEEKDPWDDDDFTVEISIKDVPDDLQRKIRSLAAANTAAEEIQGEEDGGESFELSEKAIRQIVKEVLRAKGLL